MFRNMMPAAFVLVLATQCVCGQVGLRFEFGPSDAPIIGVDAGLQAQQAAGDVFVVRIEKVITFPEQDGNGLIVKAQAKIDSVVRSSQPRRVGDDIVIRYRTTATTQFENQYDARILSDNEKISAYLNYSGAGKYYSIAAGQYSFTSSRHLQQKEQLSRSQKQAASVGVSGRKNRDPYAAKPVTPTRDNDPYDATSVIRHQQNDPYAPVGR